MTKIIKKCRHHGNLTQEEVIKSGLSSGKQLYKCRKCVKVARANNYAKNKEKILARIHANTERDPEHRKAIKRNLGKSDMLS